MLVQTYGGGAQHVRKWFFDKETALLFREARSKGGVLLDAVREENVDLVIEVMQTRVYMCRQVKGTSTQAPQLPWMAEKMP